MAVKNGKVHEGVGSIVARRQAAGPFMSLQIKLLAVEVGMNLLYKRVISALNLELVPWVWEGYVPQPR